MTIKAAIGLPPRIKEDIEKNEGRALKLFLQNVREKLNNALSDISALQTGNVTVTSTNTTEAPTPVSLTNADTLDFYDSSDFTRKTENATITGTWTHTGTLTANRFVETSDKRLKKNIHPLKRAKEIILGLIGVSYTRIDSGENEIGFIAQEVQEVLPELVSEQGDYLGVNYSRIVAVLVEAFKEQEKRIVELEMQVTKLERGN